MKAQVWSVDVAFSMIIFVTALAFILFSIYTMNDILFSGNDIGEMNSAAIRISDSLVRLPGVPENWTATNIMVLGLARDDNVLDVVKVSRMIDLDYQTLRLSTGSGRYNIYIELDYINGSIVRDIYGRNVTAGIKPMQNSTHVSFSERYAVYGDSITKLRVFIWI